MPGAAICLAIAGCGSEERVAAAPEPAATEAPDLRATPDPTELEIRQAANAYLKAYSRSDWTGVCDTLVLLRRARRPVREPFMRLYAIEEDGAWGIARSRKRRIRTGSA